MLKLEIPSSRSKYLRLHTPSKIFVLWWDKTQRKIILTSTKEVQNLDPYRYTERNRSSCNRSSPYFTIKLNPERKKTTTLDPWVVCFFGIPLWDSRNGRPTPRFEAYRRRRTHPGPLVVTSRLKSRSMTKCLNTRLLINNEIRWYTTTPNNVWFPIDYITQTHVIDDYDTR